MCYSCDSESFTLDVFTDQLETGADTPTTSRVPHPIQEVLCLPETFYADPDPSCATPTQLSLPLILSNVVFFVVTILLGRHKVQTRLKLFR